VQLEKPNEVVFDMIVSKLFTIQGYQQTIKQYEHLVKSERDAVESYVSLYGTVETDEVKASMTKDTTAVSYDSKQIELAIAQLEMLIAVTQDEALIQIHNTLSAAKKESVRSGSLRITYK
jgi:hypothetical protein